MKWILTVVSLAALIGCGDSNEDANSGSLGAGAGAGDPNSATSFNPGTGGSSSSGSGGDCSGNLGATIRDFSADHPDFEDYSGDEPYEGIVESQLGPDDKPVYAHPGPTEQTSGPDAFAQWYNDVAGINHNLPTSIQLTETEPGQFTYDNSAFFPVDGQGFGDEGNTHNYHFTTEVHTTFRYEGGEVFTFTGDDDLWLFINGRLAIDLGGLHPQRSLTVDLDASAADLQIQPGNTYPMAIFHAERHTNESNFRIQTTIGCFSPPPS
jgi:fibro-slime domain-containing protein